MNLEAVTDELYGLAPEDFTAARDARAVEARRSGDRQLAAAIKKLRRPSASAWLTNVLVRRRREQLEELLSLGAALREAQERLAADELRQLSQERHRVVSTLAQEARTLGTELGRPVSDVLVRELEGTLEAAMADPEAGEAVRRACLTVALTYSGLGPARPGAEEAAAGEALRAQPDSVIEGAPPTGRESLVDTPAEGAPAGDDDGARVEQRRTEELAAAFQRLREARSAAVDAKGMADAGRRRVAEVRDRRDDLGRQIVELEERLERLRPAMAEMDASLHQEDQRLDAAERSRHLADDGLAAAEAELDRLLR